MNIFKKVFCLLLVLMFMLIFVACDGGSKSGEVATGGKTDAEIEKDKLADEENSKNEENSMQEQESNGVSLPDGYPVDFVPIMEDAISGWGINTDGNFNLSYGTPSSGEQVMKFYRTHLGEYGDALIIADNNRELNLEAEGKKVQILIDLSSSPTNVRISINNVSTTTEDNNDSANLEGSSEMTKQFPQDIVPLMAGGNIIDQSSQDDEYSITFSINKSFKEVAEFYKKVLDTMSDANINDGDAEFFATAVKDDNSVEIQITENDSANSMVLINIYQD